MFKEQQICSSKAMLKHAAFFRLLKCFTKQWNKPSADRKEGRERLWRGRWKQEEEKQRGGGVEPYRLNWFHNLRALLGVTLPCSCSPGAMQRSRPGSTCEGPEAHCCVPEGTYFHLWVFSHPFNSHLILLSSTVSQEFSYCRIQQQPVAFIPGKPKILSRWFSSEA